MSKETKSYSPGPWSRRCNGASVIIDDANGKAVARATPRIFGELNGDLIAAAPDLLAALENLVADWERVTGTSMPADHEAKASIAKAKGGAK